MALGAQAHDVVRLVLSQGIHPTRLGDGLRVVGALILDPVSSNQCSITPTARYGHFGRDQPRLARRRVRGHVAAGAPRKPDIAHLVAQGRIASAYSGGQNERSGSTGSESNET